MLLTKHEGETFHNQTVYISGQAFVRCSFIACTLVLRETVYHLEACSFERCNWHADLVLMWGSPESLREIKALLAMIEQSQQNQQLQSDSPAPTGGLSAPMGGRPAFNVPPVARPSGPPPRISSIPPIVPRGDAKPAPTAGAASSATEASASKKAGK